MKIKKSICPYDCPTSCGLVIETDGKKILKVKGDENHPATQGLICRKMRNYEESVHSKDRILTPLKRIGKKGEGKFEKITWEEAAQEITDKWKKIIKEDGPSAILPVYYSGVMSVIHRNCGDALFNKMGACSLVKTLCSSAKGAGYNSVMGSTGALDPRELENSDYYIVWGSNMKATRIQALSTLIKARKEGKKVVLLPGPPNELLPMFHDQVEPIIKELSSEVLYSDVVKIDCMGESRVAAEIEDLIEKQTNPTVAPYAKLGEVHLRVTAKAVSEDEAKKLVTPITEELYRRFGHKIFTTKEDETLEDVVVDMLSKHHYTIAAAESCTAGMFTARLVNVAGASDVLNESFITYANEAKMKYLGVKEETLNTVGAVSEDTARQMAEGVARQAGSNVGVGITGLAGPGGETPEKKAGLVYIGVSVNGKTKVNKYQLNGNRQKVRETAVCRALTMVRHALVEEFL